MAATDSQPYRLAPRLRAVADLQQRVAALETQIAVKD